MQCRKFASKLFDQYLDLFSSRHYFPDLIFPINIAECSTEMLSQLMLLSVSEPAMSSTDAQEIEPTTVPRFFNTFDLTSPSTRPVEFMISSLQETLPTTFPSMVTSLLLLILPLIIKSWLTSDVDNVELLGILPIFMHSSKN